MYPAFVILFIAGCKFTLSEAEGHICAFRSLFNFFHAATQLRRVKVFVAIANKAYTSATQRKFYSSNTAGFIKSAMNFC